MPALKSSAGVVARRMPESSRRRRSQAKGTGLMSGADDTRARTVEPWRIIGRSSSHYTRLVRLFAEEVERPYRLQVVADLGSLSPDDYGGNPALKLPVLVTDASAVFGAENICRALARGGAETFRIVWPEDVTAPCARNAQELVWHGMQAQVQIAFGTQIASLSPDSLYFRKAAAGVSHSLRWLDDNLPAVLSALPASRDLSLFEATLFCLFEHVRFRGTVAAASCPALSTFAQAFAERPSALKTPYGFDNPGGAESG